MDLATTDRGGAVGIRVYRPFASMVMVCAYCRIRAYGCPSSPARVALAETRLDAGVVAEQSEPGQGGTSHNSPPRVQTRRRAVRRRPVGTSSTAGLRSAPAWTVVRVRCACRVFIRYKSPHRLTRTALRRLRTHEYARHKPVGGCPYRICLAWCLTDREPPLRARLGARRCGRHAAGRSVRRSCVLSDTWLRDTFYG